MLWDTLDEHIVLAPRSQGVKLKNGIADWRTSRITSLHERISFMIAELDLDKDNIPLPTSSETYPLDSI